MSLAYFREVHPPTCIDITLKASFTDETHTNLIVIKRSILEVYRLVEPSSFDNSSTFDPTDPAFGVQSSSSSSHLNESSTLNNNNNNNNSNHHSPLLKLLLSFELFGIVESAVVLRFLGSSRDALLLAFAPARFAVVEYDAWSNSLRTVSLHYYENDPSLTHGFSRFASPPSLAVDPLHRCAVALIFDRSLVVFPFHQRPPAAQQASLADAAEQNSHRRRPVGDSYALPLDQLGVRHVRALTFLHDYYEPTLLLLHEPRQTWAGRSASLARTCVITAVSLNVPQRRHHTIWRVAELPEDCQRLVPLPRPIGGALVVAPHCVLYFKNTNVRYARAVHPCAPDLRDYLDRARQHELEVEEREEHKRRAAAAADSAARGAGNGEAYALPFLNAGAEGQFGVGAGDAKDNHARVVDTLNSILKLNDEKHAASLLANQVQDDEVQDPNSTTSTSTTTATSTSTSTSTTTEETAQPSTEELHLYDFIPKKSTRQQQEEKLCISLENARHAFLARDKLILSNDAGELYLLHLDASSSAQSVSIAVEKAGSSVIASSMTTLSDHFLFIGSRVGDSVLLSYYDKTKLGAARRPSRRAPKRPRLQQPSLDDAAADPDDLFALLSRELGLGERMGAFVEEFEEVADSDEDEEENVQNELQLEVQQQQQQSNTSSSLITTSSSQNQTILTDDDNFLSQLQGNPSSTSLSSNPSAVASNPSQSSSTPASSDSTSSSVMDLMGIYGQSSGIDDVSALLGIYGSAPSDPTPSASQPNSVTQTSSSSSSISSSSSLSTISSPAFSSDPSSSSSSSSMSSSTSSSSSLFPSSLSSISHRHSDASSASRGEDSKLFRRRTMVFTIADTLVNIGPIRDLALIDAPNESQPWLRTFPDPETSVDIVTASGHGKNGSVCVMQQFRPNCNFGFDLSSVTAVWTLQFSPPPPQQQQPPPSASNGEEERITPPPPPPPRESPKHEYIILGQGPATRMFHAGTELRQLRSEETGMLMMQHTLEVGMLLKGQLWVQVLSREVRLLGRDLRLVHRLSVPQAVVRSSVVDPFVSLLLADGSLCLVQANAQERRLELLREASNIPVGAEGTAIVDHCVYVEEAMDGHSKHLFPTAPPSFVVDPSITPTSSSTSSSSSTSTPSSSSLNHSGKRYQPSSSIATATYYQLVLRWNGQLEFYRLPEVHPVLVCKSLNDLPWLLVGAPPASLPFTVAAAPFSANRAKTSPAISEILLTHLGSPTAMPSLFLLLSSGELVVYRGFLRARAGVRFSKERIHHFTKNPFDHDVSSPNGSGANNAASLPPRDRRAFHVWQNSRSHERSLFVAGENAVLVTCARDALQYLPLSGRIPILSFAPFHNVSCEHGFILTTSRNVRFCTFDHSLSVTAPWRVNKLHLRTSEASAHRPTTAHNVNYLPDGQVIVLVVSQTYSPDPVQGSATLEVDESGFNTNKDNDDQQQQQQQQQHNVPSIPTTIPTTPSNFGEKLPLKPKSPIEKFEVRLLNSSTWEIFDRYPLEENEQVLAVKPARIRLSLESSDASKFRNFLAVGTGVCVDEDHLSRGRVLLFEVLQSHIGLIRTNKPKLSLLCAREVRGPVTALTEIDGYLVVASGNKIFLFWYNPKDTDLLGAAFFDTEIYVTEMRSLKNLLVVADVSRSVYFIHWNGPARSLSLLAKDYHLAGIDSAEFLVANAELTLLLADAESNLQLFNYDPLSSDSDAGQQLLPVADFHAATHVTKFLRMPLYMPGSGPLTDRLRHITFFGSREGSLGFVLPIDEDIFRRLSMLSKKLQTAVPHFAGLNPKAYRTYQPRFKTPQRHRPNILDGHLLAWFLLLPKRQQSIIALSIGTTVTNILSSLYTLERMMALF